MDGTHKEVVYHLYHSWLSLEPFTSHARLFALPTTKSVCCEGLQIIYVQGTRHVDAIFSGIICPHLYSMTFQVSLLNMIPRIVAMYDGIDLVTRI